MAKQTKPDMAFLASMVEQYQDKLGLDVDMDSVKESEELAKERRAKRLKHTMEVEGTIGPIHHKHLLMFKNCPICKRTFETNHCFEVHCSDECRAVSFYAEFGMTWEDLHAKLKTPASFWEHEIPIVISPATVEAKYEWAKAFVENYEEFKERIQTRSQEASRLDQERLDALLDSDEVDALLAVEIGQHTVDTVPTQEDDGIPQPQALSVPGQFDLGILDFDL